MGFDGSCCNPAQMTQLRRVLPAGHGAERQDRLLRAAPETAEMRADADEQARPIARIILSPRAARSAISPRC
ncbi:MAG: hypothetical protein MZV49_01690 [Rhodopseudomonas palustris]|nr:hypothetical protein [Rhodopseudomonas palustris]